MCIKWSVLSATQRAFRRGPDPRQFQGREESSSIKSSGLCALCCLHEGFPVELEGQMSAFKHCLHEVIGHDSSRCWEEWMAMVVLWRPSIALALHTLAAAFFHELTLSLLPPPPSYLPKMCQLENKGMIRGAFWLESCRAQQLPCALSLAVLPVMFHCTFA